jgi:hypothetical protein
MGKLDNSKELLYLIPAAASLLVPVVGWIMSSIGLGRKQKQIEYFIRRLDLSEKLNNSVVKCPNEEDLKFLTVEIEEMLDYLKSTAVTGEAPANIIPLTLVRVRSTFLLYNPHSVKGWVYLVVFYFSLIGLLTGVYMIKKDTIFVGIVTSVFYFIMAVVFQRLAVKNARKLEECRKK